MTQDSLRREGVAIGRDTGVALGSDLTCMSDIAVPGTLAAGVAQAQVRIQDVVGELRELRRLLRNVALSEARAARARKVRRARRA